MSTPMDHNPGHGNLSKGPKVSGNVYVGVSPGSLFWAGVEA